MGIIVIALPRITALRLISLLIGTRRSGREGRVVIGSFGSGITLVLGSRLKEKVKKGVLLEM